jgi:hypothetical protein
MVDVLLEKPLKLLWLLALIKLSEDLINCAGSGNGVPWLYIIITALSVF